MNNCWICVQSRYHLVYVEGNVYMQWWCIVTANVTAKRHKTTDIVTNLGLTDATKTVTIMIVYAYRFM